MKTISSLTAIALIIIGFSHTYCQRDRPDSASILKIQYGTSFGECFGYCKQNIALTRNKTEFTKSGLSETISCNENTDSSLWSQLMKEIDTSAFNSLKETIGCPDCADGGAEWIEIESGASKHKVTFEYMNEPPTVKIYIDKLRSLHNKFKDCSN
jgi:hypothetical protein